MLKAVLIDHHDSFTYNIKAWLKSRFVVSIVDYQNISSLDTDEYDLIILSPGPKTPSDYPLSQALLQKLPSQKPVLGICLGMQLMNESEGGKVSAYYPPVHGKSSALESTNPIYQNLQIGRYHSLKCIVANSFQILASSEQIPMIICHNSKKWLGMQFHPESFLTEKAEIYLQAAVNLCSQ